MRKKITIFGAVAVCGAALLGGVISYNSNANDSKLFRENVEALADEPEFSDWYWDADCECWMQGMSKAPKF